MKARFAATCIATTFALAVFESHATDWIDRAAMACAHAREAPAACERTRALVRAALDTASHGPSRNGSNGANGASGPDSLGRAASAVAAYVVLEGLYPDQQPEFERLLAIELADFPESQAKADALARGRQVGLRVLP